jgi:hypothetical protein
MNKNIIKIIEEYTILPIVFVEELENSTEDIKHMLEFCIFYNDKYIHHQNIRECKQILTMLIMFTIVIYNTFNSIIPLFILFFCIPPMVGDIVFPSTIIYKTYKIKREKYYWCIY